MGCLLSMHGVYRLVCSWTRYYLTNIFGIKRDSYSYLFIFFLFSTLKEKFTQKLIVSHHPLTPMSIESQVKSQNISEASK